jgi:hypothetical protein
VLRACSAADRLGRTKPAGARDRPPHDAVTGGCPAPGTPGATNRPRPTTASRRPLRAEIRAILMPVVQ